MAQQGYLLITDIAGYTAFLTQAELEHAQDILNTLFHALLENTKFPLIVSKLEGDAIFSYAPEKSFFNPQILLETIENLYCVFADTQEKMHRNTTCTCTACRLIPDLDLKFVMHYGEFLEVKIGGGQELSGTNVIVVHRLLKNSITEKIGVEAYAYFSKASIEAAGLTDMAAQMIPHSESYEHLGEIQGYVYNLKTVWEAQREARRVQIAPESAALVVEEEFHLPPATVWDCLFKPEYKQIMSTATQPINAAKKGRISAGTEFHCYHGKRLTRQRVVDWHPFEYYTSQDTTSMVLFMGQFTVSYTVYLLSEGDKTHVKWVMQHLYHKNPVRQQLLNLMWKLAKNQFESAIKQGLHDFKTKITEDLAAGIIVAQVEKVGQLLDDISAKPTLEESPTL